MNLFPSTGRINSLTVNLFQGKDEDLCTYIFFSIKISLIFILSPLCVYYSIYLVIVLKTTREPVWGSVARVGDLQYKTN